MSEGSAARAVLTFRLISHDWPMQLTTGQHSPSTLSRRSPPRAAVALLLLAIVMLVVFALDRGTGLPHVQHLYYIPIIVAAVRFGTFGGAAVAVLAVVLYHLANPQALTWRYEESDVLQMAVFVAVGVVAAKLADDARRFRELAMTDDLTGLHNLRSFELQLRDMTRAAHAVKGSLSLLVLDVDRLKSLNDEYGHLAGAEAVRTVARIIGEHIPADAVACRYGGDEFVVALPCATPEASRVAGGLRQAVLSCGPMLAGLQFPSQTLSISIGLASRSFHEVAVAGQPSTEDDDGEALFRMADAALYAAKNGGRNRVHVA
jgi:diguanylate cyclase (GGDEF)-like protein